MNDFIEIYENSASQELCDKLVNWFDFCSDNNFTLNNMNCAYPFTVRSDESLAIPNNPVSSFSAPAELIKDFWEVLEKCFIDYLEKYDINEELIRLESNLRAFDRCLELNKPNGKKLGFISQELSREIM